jgi:hypothetical protein
VRERGLVGDGFLRERFLGEVTQDSFVEGGEGVESGGGEQVDEMPADVVHVLGRCVLNGAASGGQKADPGAAAEHPAMKRTELTQKLFYGRTA